MLTTAEPIGAWPDTQPEQRQVVGCSATCGRETCLRAVRGAARATPTSTTLPGLFDRDVAVDPAHGRHTRVEDRADLQDLAERGFLYDVLVDGAWAGVLAAEPDARRGVRGATVVELILDHRHRGRGYGRHLSTLLARSRPAAGRPVSPRHHPCRQRTSYRSALAAGRVDVGGEIVIPLERVERRHVLVGQGEPADVGVGPDPLRR